jgi:hypothetical protein
MAEGPCMGIWIWSSLQISQNQTLTVLGVINITFFFLLQKLGSSLASGINKSTHKRIIYFSHISWGFACSLLAVVKGNGDEYKLY